jgi:hypothetical protein
MLFEINISIYLLQYFLSQPRKRKTEAQYGSKDDRLLPYYYFIK